MTDETPAPTARIKRIEVIGLFGLYDHVIDLNLEARVTILHGPNGVGKTILLQMLRALLTGQLAELAQIPFKDLSVQFTSGARISVATSLEEDQISVDRNKPPIHRTWKRVKFTYNDEVTDVIFEPGTSSPALGVFKEAGMDANFIQRPAPQFPGLHWSDPSALDPWPFRSPIDIHIVEAQRMSQRPQRENQGAESTHYSSGFPAVWGDAIDLERKIASHLKQYGTITQDLDQSFATRLIQGAGRSVPSQELKARMTAVEALRTALQSNGILDERSAKPFDVSDLDTLSQAQRDVLALVVEDNEKKLGVFADLLVRVELLLRIVNNRLRNKSLRADHKHGLVVHDHHGRLLELRALSSGEQQQIILVYDLLFRVKKDTLVSIDEPELSLHVLWQKRFLPDLLEIVKVTGIDALIATHSPFIVGDRSDLMVALDAEIDHDEPVQP